MRHCDERETSQPHLIFNSSKWMTYCTQILKTYNTDTFFKMICAPTLYCLISLTQKRTKLKYIKIKVKGGEWDNPKGRTIIYLFIFNKMQCAHMNYSNRLLSLESSGISSLSGGDRFDNLTQKLRKVEIIIADVKVNPEDLGRLLEMRKSGKSNY